MSTRLFVGNLSYSTNEDSLRKFFENKNHPVVEVQIVNDRETGRSKGFGFVQLGGEGPVQDTIDSLNGQELDGRRLAIREAHERKPGPRGGGGGGGFRGGGDGGGGFRGGGGGFRDGGGRRPPGGGPGGRGGPRSPAHVEHRGRPGGDRRPPRSGPPSEHRFGMAPPMDDPFGVGTDRGDGRPGGKHGRRDERDNPYRDEVEGEKPRSGKGARRKGGGGGGGKKRGGGGFDDGW